MTAVTQSSSVSWQLSERDMVQYITGTLSQNAFTLVYMELIFGKIGYCLINTYNIALITETACPHVAIYSHAH